MKSKTCFKSVINPSCIDLFIINNYRCFQNTTVISTGLSDFHKMAYYGIEKSKPKEIIYRNYKNFANDIFKYELKTLLEKECSSYKHFQETFLKVLDKHAPVKKKIVRANNQPYMNKTLRKAMIRGSQLETKFYKTKNFNDERNYKKQKKIVSRLYKKNFKCFYRNLNLTNVLDNKNFWKNIKPLFSDKSPKDKTITIVHENEVYSDDKEVSELLNLLRCSN